MKSQRERYVEDVMGRIFSEEDQRRFADDLAAHFEDGAAAGESEAAIIARLGSPEEVAASFAAGLETHYAGFWIRSCAFLVDVATMAALVLPFFLAILVASLPVEGDLPEAVFLVLIVPVTLWAIALGIFYFPVLEYHYGKTLGKHLLGLRVLTDSGTRISLGQAFLRRLSSYFEFLVLDALFVPFNAKKQRAFDMVAKTTVVRERTDVAAGWAISLAILMIPVIAILTLVFLSFEAA